MGFSSLLGNDRLRRRLESAFAGGTVSHSWLLAGPAGAGKHTLATLMAAAMQCTAGTDVPCCRCSQCRKVLHGTHPDVITVDSEKKSVPVEQMRSFCADLSIRPHEGKHKIYILPRAQDLHEASQNALLKSMEEPPPYGVFLLLTTGQENLLPTIRSRCATLVLEPLPEKLLEQELAARMPDTAPADRALAAARSGGWLGQALDLLENGVQPAPQTQAFAAAWASRDPAALLEVLVPLEKTDRVSLAALLQQWIELLHSALLVSRTGCAAETAAGTIAASRTAGEILTAIEHLQQARAWCEANVSSAHICGALAALL